MSPSEHALAGPARRILAGLLAASLVGFLSLACAIAEDPPPPASLPLHERIDRLVEASHDGPLAPLANDNEFIRRVTLDLAGRIPSAAEVRGFVADPAANKREALVDRLLAGPEFARHMAVVLDVALMERRAQNQIPPAEWRQYLFASMLANKPYDQLAREILSADGADPQLRPAAKFYLDRDVETNALARDVGRMFFGQDMQCAQCHDHPIVEDYKQRDYYGIFAFLNRSFLFTDKEKKVFLGEKADGGTAFQSVFTREKGQTGPRLPGGAAIEEPAFPPGEEYDVKPDKEVRPIPKYSRRVRMAKLATSGANRAFNRNFANRLWAMMLGRGLVEPVDLHHSGNPPAHPELLELLTDEVVALKYDMRAVLRELALTRTYQRSIDLPEGIPQRAAEVAARLPQYAAEYQRLAAAAEQSKQSADAAEVAALAARLAAAAAGDELAQAETAAAAAKKEADAGSAALAAAQSELAAKQGLAQTLAEASAKGLEAAGKLPEDKELAAAAEKFKTKSEQTAAEVTAIAKRVADQQPIAKTMADKLAAAQQVTTAASAKRDAAQQQAAPLTEQAAAAHAKRQVDRATVLQMAGRRDAASALVEYNRTTTAANASRDALAQIDAQRIPLRQNLEKTKADMTQLLSALAAMQPPADDAARQLAATQKQAADAAAAQAAALEQQLKALDDSARQPAEKAQADRALADGALADLTKHWNRRFALAALKPLSPEQLGWSIMQAVGLVDQQRAAAEAEWVKQHPTPDPAQDPAALAVAKTRQAEQFVYEKLSPNEATFVSLFAASPGQPQQDFSATADQALFLENGGVIRGWLAPGGGNLTERAVAQADPKLVAEEIYVNTLSRQPTDQESAEVAAYLAARAADRPAAVQEIIWGLLVSAEFRFNH